MTVVREEREQDFDRILGEIMDGIEDVIEGRNVASALAALGIIQRDLLADMLNADTIEADKAVLSYISMVKDTMIQLEILATTTEGETIN